MSRKRGVAKRVSLGALFKLFNSPCSSLRLLVAVRGTTVRYVVSDSTKSLRPPIAYNLTEDLEDLSNFLGEVRRSKERSDGWLK